MLRYIKKSGVSGGVKQLGYTEMKTLMLEYPLSYLEFEVIFVKVIRKK
jgi:malonyl-CoA O-methyltransferase